ncbi:hypothetical protein [Microvirga vignae]|uniref:hypothetical protein n=1 Tax=Microvirga vignae TaxID=1225564 RepID=UPI001FCDF7C5|nr:hypothetical protein [Microvirga vignae]
MSLGWSLGFGLGVSAVFLVGGGLFIDFVSTSPDVRVYARDYLVFAALTPFIGAAAFAFDGIYTGATWTGAMRNLMILAFAIYGLVLHDEIASGELAAYTCAISNLTRSAYFACYCPT